MKLGIILEERMIHMAFVWSLKERQLESMS